MILTNGKTSEWWYRYSAENHVFTCISLRLISIWCNRIGKEVLRCKSRNAWCAYIAADAMRAERIRRSKIVTVAVAAATARVNTMIAARGSSRPATVRCSGRDWLRPGGAARAGALLVRPSLRRAPAGLERCGSGCPALLVAASLRPGAAALALGSVRGLQAPRARCGGAEAIVGRLLLLAMPLRRHGRLIKRSRAAVQGGIFAFMCDFCALLAGKKGHFAAFRHRKKGVDTFLKTCYTGTSRMSAHF